MKRQYNIILSSLLIWLLLLSCSETAYESISSHELLERVQDGSAPLILDVRSEEEFKGGHIEGAVHIPLDKLKNRLKNLQSAALEYYALLAKEVEVVGSIEEEFFEVNYFDRSGEQRSTFKQ